MDQSKIREAALQSLHTYFKNAMDNKGEAAAKPLTKEEITAEVKKQIAAEKAKLDEQQETLSHLNDAVDMKVEAVYAKVFGEAKEVKSSSHPTYEEIKKALEENVKYQEYVANKAKEEKMK